MPHSKGTKFVAENSILISGLKMLGMWSIFPIISTDPHVEQTVIKMLWQEKENDALSLGFELQQTSQNVPSYALTRASHQLICKWLINKHFHSYYEGFGWQPWTSICFPFLLSFSDLSINTGVMNVGNKYFQSERKKHHSQSNMPLVTATHCEW